jgi:hypothetical protein
MSSCEQALGVGGEHVEVVQGHAGTGAAVRGGQALAFDTSPLACPPEPPLRVTMKYLIDSGPSTGAHLHMCNPSLSFCGHVGRCREEKGTVL